MKYRVPKPIRERVGRSVSSPDADFAFKYKMITKDEYHEILQQNMDLNLRSEKPYIVNLIADLDYIRTGEVQELFMGRAEKIQINQLLGITEPPQR